MNFSVIMGTALYGSIINLTRNHNKFDLILVINKSIRWHRSRMIKGLNGMSGISHNTIMF